MMSDHDEKLQHDEKGTGTPVPTGLTIDVTPEMVVGNSVICDISPAQGTPPRYCKGGIIKLPVAGQPYAITFQLIAGNVPGLQFAPNDPFWSLQGSCPTGGNDPQFQPQTPCNSTNVVVNATPRPPKNAVSYRLNFTLNGTAVSCDPIIVNG
jgi:hypothetical protein